MRADGRHHSHRAGRRPALGDGRLQNCRRETLAASAKAHGFLSHCWISCCCHPTRGAYPSRPDWAKNVVSSATAREGLVLASISLRRLRHRVLAEFRKHLLRKEPHRIALPFAIGAAPVEARHQQRAERTNLIAKRDQLVEKRLRRAMDGAAP